MQATGRIDQHHIDRARFGRHNPVEGHRRRIGAVTLANDLNPDPICPDLQLLARRRTKRVAGDE